MLPSFYFYLKVLTKAVYVHLQLWMELRRFCRPCGLSKGYFGVIFNETKQYTNAVFNRVK
ncbi:MAG: hypothetical protein OFPI_30070 [Osedax symbiont Rs2]|nr:MAG: hypothetical protein OFPI_30070 [Osedax symbiont Rs2]